jgi:chloramphenicol 3-O phosphotransferase
MSVNRTRYGKAPWPRAARCPFCASPPRAGYLYVRQHNTQRLMPTVLYGANPHAPGKIILLNGASSSGKSTLAASLQSTLDEPFWHYSIDHLLAANVLPNARLQKGDFAWQDLRPAFFAGFHMSIPALVNAGNNLIVEHIVETDEWMRRLVGVLCNLDLFFVGLHCPLEELERRERLRGDRRIGEAKADFENTHRFCTYDIEVSSAQSVEANAKQVIAAWKERKMNNPVERIARHRSAA